MIGDNAENTGSLENDRIDTTMNNENNMDKSEGDKIPYKRKDNTENTDSLENTNTARTVNNENSMKGTKKREEDIIINGNTDSRKIEISRASSMPEEINNTGIKCSWAEETEKTDIVRELL